MCQYVYRLNNKNIELLSDYNMAPINIKEIIKVSSEDEKYSANNLIKGQKWMCCSKNQNEEASVEFLFEKPSQINYVDIGYCNVASIEIHVGLQTWPQYKEMLVLLPTMMTQTCIEAKTGKNKSGCKMFNHEDHLNPDVAKQFWDKIKVILRQPYNKTKYFGLEFMRFGTPRNVEAKSNNTPQKQSTNHTVKTSTPQNFHLSKLMERMRQKNSTPTDSMLERKLKRLSGSGHVENDESALNRTAKMILASKMKSPSTNGFKSPTCNKNTVPKNANSSTRKTPLKFPKQHKDSPSSCKSQNPSNNLQLDEKPKHQSKTNQGIPTESDANLPLRRHKVNLGSPKPQTSKAHITECELVQQNKDDKSSDCEIVESSRVKTEPVYTKKQIKQLKKAIKRFFNSLDIDHFNPNEVKLKDLRKQFERRNEIELNRDGRVYYREVADRFVNIVEERRRNKLTANTPGTSTKRKLQNDTNQSPAKVRKPLFETSSTSHPPQMLTDPSVEMTACPICNELFPGSTIEIHAASCGDDSSYDYQYTLSSNNQTYDGVNTANMINQMSNISRSHVDCSENSTLTAEEQLKWIQFSKEPKPYQKRVNRSDFEGCKLVRCPSCGQLYKSSEIQAHSDECAEKVNCGLTKMGLYYVDQRKKIVKPTKAKAPIIIELDD